MNRRSTFTNDQGKEITKLKKCFLALLFFLSVLFYKNSDTFALSMTFEGSVAGHNMLFTVYGDVGGTNNIGHSLPSGTTWNHEWGISSISNWAILDSLVPSTYSNNDNAYGQMLLIKNTDYTEFRYHELLNGFNLNSLEIWSHEIDIRSHISTPAPIESLLNVDNAFSYIEYVGYATNYSADNSTTANWLRQSVEGTLTLVAFDLSSNPPGPGTTPVPEPATMFLFGLGLLGLAVLRRRFKQ